MPSRRRLVGACLIAAVVVAGASAVSWEWLRIRQIGLAIAGATPVMVEVVTAGIGVWLVYLFWPRRLGWGLHCKRCGYYQERQGRLAPACPECGAAWLWIGETRSGKPTGARSMVALGVLLCVLAGAGALMSRAAPWVYLRLLPDRVILEQLGTLPDDLTSDLWGELKRRNFAQATIDALARPLLLKKARDGYLSLAAESVVFDAMMRPGAPNDLTTTYFASFLSGQMDAPASVEEGGLIAVKALATFKGRTLTTGTPPRVIVLSALYRGRETEPVQTWEWELNPEAAASQRRPMQATFAAGSPGAVELRQVFWLAIGSPGVERVAWVDGKPQVPLTMSIKDTFEESRSVRVLDKPKPPLGQPR